MGWGKGKGKRVPRKRVPECDRHGIVHVARWGSDLHWLAPYTCLRCRLEQVEAELALALRADAILKAALDEEFEGMVDGTDWEGLLDEEE